MNKFNNKINLNEEIEDYSNKVEIEQYKNNSLDILFYRPVSDYSCLKLTNA